MKYGELNLGQIEAIVNKLGGMDGVRRLLADDLLVQERPKPNQFHHTINCDADPFVPDVWRVQEHTKGGIFTWDPTTVKLYLSKKQAGNKYIVGNDLRKELASQPTLNANILDYLLAHPDLIPDEWKGKYVFFWGTVYRRAGGNLCVRYLYWNDYGWVWNYYWLDFEWYSDYPAAVAS